MQRWQSSQTARNSALMPTIHLPVCREDRMREESDEEDGKRKRKGGGGGGSSKKARR